MSFNQPMWFLTFQELVLQGYLQLYDDDIICLYFICRL